MTADTRRQRGDLIPCRVVQQGAVRFNWLAVEADRGDVLLCYGDLHSKYADLMSVGADPAGPCLYFVAHADTLHCDDSQPREALTMVQIDLPGWEIFCCDGPGRYSFAVALVRSDVLRA